LANLAKYLVSWTEIILHCRIGGDERGGRLGPTFYRKADGPPFWEFRT